MSEPLSSAANSPEIQYDQSDRIRELEKRLNDLEEKLEQITGNNHDDSISEIPHEENNGRPATPPTIPEVRKVDVYQYAYHLLPTDTIPVIEAAIQATGESNLRKEFPAFKESLLGLSSTELVQKLTRTSIIPDTTTHGLLKFRVNSTSLSGLLLALLCKYDTLEEHMLCFTRPYRVPIYYHGEVKRKLSELEALEKSQEQGDSDHASSKNSLLLNLRCYVEIMERDIIPFYTRFDTLTASDNVKVHFRDLWHLFKPGDTIFYPRATSNPSVGDYQKLHRSQRADQKLWRVYTRKEEDDKFWVKAYCIDYDGENFLCVKEWFEIPKYEYFASVNSLTVYPLRFATNAQDIMNDSIKYGRKFQTIIGEKLMTHDGWASEFRPNDPTMRYVTSDVVIDLVETFRTYPDWKPICKLPSTSYRGSRGAIETENGCLNWCWHDGKKVQMNDARVSIWQEGEIPRLEKRTYCHEKDQFLGSWLNDHHGPSIIPDDDLHLLPRRVFAYSFQDRMFLAVDVANLEPVEEGRSKSDNLVIDTHHRTVLHAVVKSHFEQKKIRSSSDIRLSHQDIVHNKGRGLIILLHGVPGVGKTSTAETIASEFGKPLLPITCGDLGLDPATVEKSLKQMFRAAQLWDCILLLDEAEVFLAERMTSDLSRNALVSVFLRVLDYYSGILFLTTNRVGSIDEAFKSRIHISLYYEHLNRRQTTAIWKVNLDRLIMIEEEKKTVAKHEPLRIDQRGILEYADHHYRSNKHGTGRWNGRQIRNAFLIASALARYKKNSAKQDEHKVYDLDASHFKRIAAAGIGFERYLLEAKGRTDNELAFVQGLRADYFKSKKEKETDIQIDEAHVRHDPSKLSQPAMPARSPSRNESHRPSQQFSTTQHGALDEGFFSPGQNTYANIPLHASQFVPGMMNTADRYSQYMNYMPSRSATPSINPPPHPENITWKSTNGRFEDSEED